MGDDIEPELPGVAEAIQPGVAAMLIVDSQARGLESFVAPFADCPRAAQRTAGDHPPSEQRIVGTALETPLEEIAILDPSTGAIDRVDHDPDAEGDRAILLDGIEQQDLAAQMLDGAQAREIGEKPFAVNVGAVGRLEHQDLAHASRGLATRHPAPVSASRRRIVGGVEISQRPGVPRLERALESAAVIGEKTLDAGTDLIELGVPRIPGGQSRQSDSDGRGDTQHHHTDRQKHSPALQGAAPRPISRAASASPRPGAALTRELPVIASATRRAEMITGVMPPPGRVQ